MSQATIGRQGLTRDLNVRAVFEHLATVGPTSRADLARELSLSPASVTRLVDGLLAADLVREGERVTHGVGRPQTLLRVHSDAACVAGVSVRSRSLGYRLTDLDGAVVAHGRVPRRDGDSGALARQIRDLVVDSAGGRRLAGLVVGLCAVWDDVGRVAYAAPNAAILEGCDVRGAIESAFADRLDGPVAVDNDVNLAAVGEGADGAARGVDDFFFVNLGSGVGGAAVVDRAVQRGAHGFAGEIGHLPVAIDGGVRPLESVIGRAALELKAREHDLGVSDDVFALLADPTSATSSLGRYVAYVLGQALAAVVTTFDPARIVIGGGTGRFAASWTDEVRDRIGDFVPVVPEVVGTSIGRDASLQGAVATALTLAREALVSRIGAE